MDSVGVKINKISHRGEEISCFGDLLKSQWIILIILTTKIKQLGQNPEEMIKEKITIALDVSINPSSIGKGEWVFPT